MRSLATATTAPLALSSAIGVVRSTTSPRAFGYCSSAPKQSWLPASAALP